MPVEFSKFDFYWSLSRPAAIDLTDTEFRVLVLVANYADGKTGKRAFPSADTLAAQMGKSSKTVRRALTALVAKGWLVRTDRPGKTAEYQLVTLDTQMSRVEDTTLDKSDTTLDIAMSTHPGHLGVHRSDQGSDPLRIRSVSRSDHHGQDIEDVQPGTDPGEDGIGRPLAVAVERQATGPDSDPWGGSTSEPATAEPASAGGYGQSPSRPSETSRLLGSYAAPTARLSEERPLTVADIHSQHFKDADDPFAAEPANQKEPA